jgi:hypothetical protein
MTNLSSSEPLWHWQRSRGQNGLEDEIRVTIPLNININHGDNQQQQPC